MDALRRRLEQLYDEHAAHVFRFGLRVTRSEEDARDVLQTVFLKLARRPEILEGVAKMRSFLFRMAHRQIADLVRQRESRRKREQDYTSDQLTTSERLETPANKVAGLSGHGDLDVARVLKRVGQLSPEQRAVVHLRIWEDMTFAQVAEALEIPLHTAASRYRYALDKIRRGLRPSQQKPGSQQAAAVSSSSS